MFGGVLSHAALGGWQALDATPQEVSNGMYQCGPAPVAAIRLGLGLPKYDCDFLIGEVNADVRRYVQLPNGTVSISSIDTKDVGRKILTKELGSFQRDEDLSSRYKAPEGSGLERASLLRTEHEEVAATTRGQLELTVNAGKVIMVGSTFGVSLRLTWPAGSIPPSARSSSAGGEIKLAIVAFATEYTGRGRHVLGRAFETVSTTSATMEVSLEMDSSSAEFERMHTGSGFPLIVVGTAMWEDEAAAGGQVPTVNPNPQWPIDSVFALLTLPPLSSGLVLLLAGDAYHGNLRGVASSCPAPDLDSSSCNCRGGKHGDDRRH